MFKFFKELKESVQEGLDEARQEVAAERAEAERVPEVEIGLEQLALAFSCPFREVLISGGERRLFQLHTLQEKEKKEATKLLRRDFDIVDQASLNAALEASKVFPSLVFRHSVCLYQITAAADLGYIDFSDYQDRCRTLIEGILAAEGIVSWQTFANAFMAGDLINSGLGKKIIARSVRSLLEEARSPWGRIHWAEIPGVLAK